MTDNFKLTIEYDGTNYHGWQRQADDRTIQGQIESALLTMTRQKITLIGSGRTDAGVHAIAQTANFHCNTQISPQAFQRGLNSLLPGDIVIRRCTAIPGDFHARYDVKSKVYQYTIFNSQLPAALGRQYHWWLRTPMDLEAMQAASHLLLGRQDFKSFEAAGSPRSHTIRHVTAASWSVEPPQFLRFSIQADGFLRCMVRNIVGTLVEVGRGKMTPGLVHTILEGHNRAKAGATAPPQGLCLIQVNY